MSAYSRLQSEKKKHQLNQEPPLFSFDDVKVFKSPAKGQKYSPKIGSPSCSTKKCSLSPKMSINTENFVISKVGSFDKDYMVVGKIGQGCFGSVYKVYHKALKSFRALKTIKKNPKSEFSALEEINILKKLDHSNILKIYEFYEAKQSLYIVTDFFQGRQLFDQIVENQKITESIAVQILTELLRALNYIHSQGIAHRDIKAENILLKKGENGKFKVKIIDWGLGTLLDQAQQKKRVCGTAEYCAPEVLSGKYSLSCDMWSLGVLTYVMLTGEMPFCGKNSQETIKQVEIGSFNMKDKSFRRLSKEAQNFIAQLIQKDPKKRLTAEQALKHTWISQFNDGFSQSPPEHLKQTLQRLRNFKITNCFGMAVVSYVNNHLTNEQEKEKLIEIFRFLDKNGDGVLSSQQLIEGYSEIYGKAMATKIAEQTFLKLDINQNGSLQFSQFVTFGLIRQKQQEKLKLQQAFNLFDKDKNGYISMEEIKQILVGKFEGSTISEEELKQIIQQIDENGDQEIDFEEFVKCINTIYEKVVTVKKGKANKAKK